MTKYRTICADFPWAYGDAGVRGGTKRHYEAMSMDQIRAMPIGDLAETESHLYLWATNSFLAEAISLFPVYGFSFKTCVTWVKMNPATNKVRIGNGYWFRASTEHLLFGVRGKLGPGARNLPTHIFAPRRAHSEKPVEAYAVMEKMSPYFRLELFARGLGRKNWDRWGHEAAPGDGRVLLPYLDLAAAG